MPVAWFDALGLTRMANHHAALNLVGNRRGTRSVQPGGVRGALREGSSLLDFLVCSYKDVDGGPSLTMTATSGR